MTNPVSTANFFGHPIHPMLIPFPIAFFVGTFLSDLAFWWTGFPIWITAATWLLGAGLVMAMAAAAAGVIDFLGDARIRTTQAAWQHAIGNVLAALIAAFNFYWHYSHETGAVLPVGLVASGAVVAILLFTGWMGWEMLYRHRVAVYDEETPLEQPPESGDHDFASQHGPLVRIPVCVPVERRKSTSLWLDVVWLPCAMLTGGLVAIPWTQLENDGDAALYFAGMADIELYRTEADRYRSNLDSGAPSVWVALQRIDGEPPYKLAAVTADPAEGESLTEPGTAVVEAVSRTVPLSPRHRQHGRAFRRRRRRDRDGVSDFSTTHWSSRHDDG